MSATRSVPGKPIVFFADCANQKRFYVEETELTRPFAAVSETAKLAKLTDHEADAKCEAAIQRKLAVPRSFTRRPSTLDLSRGRTRIRRTSLSRWPPCMHARSGFSLP